MLTLSQIQAGAYWDGECSIICVKCGDKKRLPISAQIIRYTLDSEWAEEGLYCDECGAEIVEPYIEEQEESEGDSYEDHDEEVPES